MVQKVHISQMNHLFPEISSTRETHKLASPYEMKRERVAVCRIFCCGDPHTYVGIRTVNEHALCPLVFTLESGNRARVLPGEIRSGLEDVQGPVTGIFVACDFVFQIQTVLVDARTLRGLPPWKFMCQKFWMN